MKLKLKLEILSNRNIKVIIENTQFSKVHVQMVTFRSFVHDQENYFFVFNW